MWLMKTLLTSRCINQRGAGQDIIEALEESPRHLTLDEFREDFGEVDDNVMLVNIIQLIEDGIINPKAVIR